MQRVSSRSRAMRASVAAVIAASALASGIIAPSTPAAAASPCLRVVTLGSSVQGRPIVACERGNPALRPLLFIGEIHGNESAGRATAQRLMSVRIPSRVHLWVIESINPDGHAVRSRKNAHGVDLNRNFPYGWKRRTGPYASGPRPASEPETRAVMTFIDAVQPHTTVIAHQPLNTVDISGKGDARVSRRLAGLMGMRASRLSASSAPGAKTYTGVLTAWANARVAASTAVTFEFPARPSSYRKKLLATSLMTLSKERARQRYRTRTAITWAPVSVKAGARFGIRAAVSIEGRNGRYYRKPGRPVSVFARTSSGSWVRLWSGTTGAGGVVTPPLTLSSNACLATTALADPNYWSATSPLRCLSVTR